MSEVRKFAEQIHRDEAKRSRDDHFSEVEKIKIVVWSFDERSESNFLSVCKDLCEVLKVQYLYKIILDSSMVEHSAVNRVVVGSSPTRGAQGSVVKRLRHRPFTAVTRVRFPSESF